VGRSAVRWASLGATLLLVAAVTALAIAISAFHAPGPAREDVTVFLPRGASLGAIAAALEEVEVVEGAFTFELLVRLSGDAGRLRAGEYRFPAHATAAEAARMIEGGATLKRRFTVVEGLTNGIVLALLADADGMDGAVPGAAGEGTLLPETYQYEWGDTRTAMVARMQQAMDETTATVWAARAPGLPLESPDELRVLASIVERETSLPEERPHVAGVFVNRLRVGMRLQSDSTVAYALLLRGEEARELTDADIALDHPYNTYQIAGLPPGPIANPGLASLQAAANPLDTPDLYFVADGTGGHAFAATLADHNRNVARYRQLQD
jgi:UPF0755 protein